MIQIKKLRNYILILMEILFLFLPVNNVQAYEGTKEPELKIQYGFDQYAKYGRHMPLNVHISEIDEEFSGTIQVIIHVSREGIMSSSRTIIQGTTTDSENYMYEKPVTVEKGGTSDVAFAIPLISNASKIKIRLVDDNDEVIKDQEVNVNLNTLRSELFIGVLSDEESGIDVYDGITMYKYADLLTRTFHLNPVTFPEDTYGLDSLDIIIVNHFDLERLSEKQYKAMKDWVSNGGTLVCGTFDSSAKEINKILETFPIEASLGTMTKVKSDFGMEEMGIEFPHVSPETGGPEEINVLPIHIKNGEVLIESQDIPLLQKLSYGEGVIGLAGFDVLSDSFEQWENHSGLIIEEMINKLIGTSQLIEIENEVYNGASSEYWSVYYMLNSVAMDNLPGIGKYVAVLCIYIVLTGPVLYLVLKKMDKRNFMWLGVAAASVLFAAIIFLMGRETRFTAPFINYTNIVTYEDDSVDDLVYFNIKAPFNNSYFLYVNNQYTLIPISEAMYYYNENMEINLDYYNVRIKYKEKETEVEMAGLPAFTSEYFLVRKKSENQDTNSLKGEANVFQDILSGEVTNHLEYDLENAAIVLYNHVIPLGTLKSGETKDLKDYKISDFTSGYTYEVTKMLSGIEKNYSGPITDQYIRANQKNNIFSYYLSRYFGNYTDKAMLIGFSSKSDQVNFQLDSGYKAYGLTLVTAPVTVSYEKDGYSYDPFVKEKGEAINGDFDTYSNQMYSEELIMSYDLGEDLEHITLFLEDEDYYDTEYFKAFSGNMFFYNQETGIYDKVDYQNGTFSEAQLESYLTKENIIMIKYVQLQDKDYIGIKLPKLSTIGRASNAGN